MGSFSDTNSQQVSLCFPSSKCNLPFWSRNHFSSRTIMQGSMMGINLTFYSVKKSLFHFAGWGCKSTLKAGSSRFSDGGKCGIMWTVSVVMKMFAQSMARRKEVCWRKSWVWYYIMTDWMDSLMCLAWFELLEKRICMNITSIRKCGFKIL